MTAPRRSLVLAGLLLLPGLVAAVLELRHPMADPAMSFALAAAQDERRRLADFEKRADELSVLKATLNRRIGIIVDLKRAQRNPHAALVLAAARVPRGFSVSELSCTIDSSESGDEWVVTIQGDPTDAESATWARDHGKPGEGGGHVVELRTRVGDGEDADRLYGGGTWW